jgi:hypothetical protein
MTGISHGPAMPADEQPGWAEFLKIPEMWASLAITMMWVAVVFDAVYGPDFVSTSAGGNSTTIPSSIVVALFAFLGSASVAKYGFRRGEQ